MEAHVLDVVISLKGRDSGEQFIAISEDENYLYLVNGRSRRVESPKRKKRKHICFQSKIDEATTSRLIQTGKISNSEVRKILSVFDENRTPVAEGGI